MQAASEESPLGYKQADIEKTLKRLRGDSSDTVGVKMGVAVFAPCLLVVVDGCFSLPVDAARRLKQQPKRFVVEEKMSIKRGGCVVRLVEFVKCRKTTEKITEGQKIQKG